MVPQVVRTRADISNLRHPVLRKFVLNAQVPLEDPRHATHRSSGSHDPNGVARISERNRRRKTGGYKLARGGHLAHIEGARCKRQLRRGVGLIIREGSPPFLKKGQRGRGESALFSIPSG